MRGSLWFVLVCTVGLASMQARAVEAPTICPAGRSDRPAQEAAVRELGSTADLIGLAKATFVSAEGSVGFNFTRVLKGQRTPGIEFQFRRKLKTGTGEGASGFCAIEIHTGETYLIYTANGELLRAVPQSGKGNTSLSVKEELALVGQALKAQPSAAPPRAGVE